MPSDPLIYIVVLENGEVLAFRYEKDAQAILEDDSEGRIEKAYLQ